MVFFNFLGIRLGRGEKARGQIVIGTPGTCMDWVVRYKSVDPSLIKVKNILGTSLSLPNTSINIHAKTVKILDASLDILATI